MVMFQEIIAAYEKALGLIAETEDMTNLGRCCVEKRCQEVLDVEGSLVSCCSFQYGVNRGYSTNALVAKEALAEAKKLKGE
jgi:hypothetical protein